MRVGLNLLFLGPQFGGLETYVSNLIQELTSLDGKNSYFLFVDSNSSERFGDLPHNFRVVTAPLPAALRAGRILWEQILLPIQVRKYMIDVLHSPNFVGPLLVNCPSIVTICDLLYKRYPQSIPRSSMWYRSFAIPSSARRCDDVIVSSNCSKPDTVSILA